VKQQWGLFASILQQRGGGGGESPEWRVKVEWTLDFTRGWRRR